MREARMFPIICMFCGFVLFTFIADYQSVLKSRKKSFISRIQESSLMETKPMKIVIWLNPTLKGQMKWRRDFVTEKMIIPQNTGNFCFKEIYNGEMTLENDEKTLREADAIIFIEFAHYFSMKDLPPNWKSWRRPEQIWAVQIDESPAHHPKTLLEVFNWTLTYRRDSDIWIPYGRYVPKTTLNSSEEIMVGLSNDIPLSKWIKGKSKLITGVVSNCRTTSKRELIYKELIKTNKSVEIFGGCGNVKNVKEKCGFYGSPCTNYWKNLAKKYKFYMAFENSLCVDYVTEKFWRTLKWGMVPVVYGGANYEKLAPPGSYIDVSWFKSGEELMRYLERVAGNEEEYRRFFEWRRYFEAREETTRYMTNDSNIWCEFCGKLKDLKNGEIEYKTVPKDWWSRMDGFNGIPCTSYKKLLKWNI